LRPFGPVFRRQRTLPYHSGSRRRRPSLSALPGPTLSHFWQRSARRSLTFGNVRPDALSLLSTFGPTLCHFSRSAARRSLTFRVPRRDALSLLGITAAVPGMGARPALREVREGPVFGCGKCGRVARKDAGSERGSCVWGVVCVGWLKWESPDQLPGWGSRPNGCPAVTYSPTPSRVQYHRRCGS